MNRDSGNLAQRRGERRDRPCQEIGIRSFCSRFLKSLSWCGWTKFIRNRQDDPPFWNRHWGVRAFQRRFCRRAEYRLACHMHVQFCAPPVQHDAGRGPPQPQRIWPICFRSLFSSSLHSIPSIGLLRQPNGGESQLCAAANMNRSIGNLTQRRRVRRVIPCQEIGICVFLCELCASARGSSRKLVFVHFGHSEGAATASLLFAGNKKLQGCRIARRATAP
jgi:hypothetical protein